MPVFFWWCGGGVLCWCFWGGVLWWCFCGAVLVVVFVLWCFCGGVFVGGVFVLVFLCWCFCGVVAVVWLRWCSSGGVFVVVFLWWCTKYSSSTTEYYSVLQSTTPYSKVLLQYYSNITLYYKVLLQYYSVRQSTSPTSETMSERRPSNTTPYYASTTKASKTSISCEGFRNFSRNKLPKRAFRAMLPTIFTERRSKTSVSRDASDNFHRKSLFRARLPPSFTEEASKTSVSREASFKFHRTMLPKRAFRTMLPTIFARKSFQNDRFVRGFFQISQNKLPKRAFRTMLPTIFTKKFAFRYSFAQSTHRFLREGSSAKSKMCFALQRRAFPNVTMCVSPQRRAQKCMNLSTVNRPASRTQKCEVLLQFWAIDTTFFCERVDRQKMNFAFRYSFGRPTPRFLPRGLTESK